MFKLRNKVLWSQWVPLPLRLVIGFGFMAHGWAKLSRGPSVSRSCSPDRPSLYPKRRRGCPRLSEPLGGLAIFVGAFVEVVSVPLIVMMLVAISPCT